MPASLLAHFKHQASNNITIKSKKNLKPGLKRNSKITASSTDRSGKRFVFLSYVLKPLFQTGTIFMCVSLYPLSDFFSCRPQPLGNFIYRSVFIFIYIYFYVSLLTYNYIFFMFRYFYKRRFIHIFMNISLSPF